MSVSGLELKVLVNGGEAGPALRTIAVAFERTGDIIKDFTARVGERLTPALEAEARRQFDGEGAGPSGHWAALSTAYAAWKSKAYPGAPINVRTSALRDALTSSTSPFAERVQNGDAYSYGTTNVPYASHVQLGGRPVVDLSTDFEHDINQAVADIIREAARESNLDQFAEVHP